ncbi:MAG: branched-chain amino acid ABC transporter permease [Actinomycetota bacterium]|nr:branched-chain amino acid ABC transporter permease [Actinomycetota bacterium]
MSATQAPAVEAPAIPASEEERVWTPSTRGWVARLAILGGLFFILFYVTATVPQYWADRISLAAVWAIIGLSLNVVLGYVGQLSLGHQGFIGIAAFVAAWYATTRAGCPTEQCSVGAFASSTALAVISGAVVAGLLGLVALRIKGLYLALITLAYAFMAERSIFEISALTRAGAGMPAPRPAGFTSDRMFAYLCFFFLAIVLFIDWRVLKSKAGRAILSIKHSEPVAASYGINVTLYKVLAFVLSGMFAGLAGSLLAFHATQVVSNDFQFNVALLWVLMVVVGGLGNRTGVVIGSAFFALFPFLIELIGPLSHWLEGTGRSTGEYAIVIGALLALLTLILYPGGIAEQISPITRWIRGQKFSMHPEGHGHHKTERASPLSKLRRHKKGEPDAQEVESTDKPPPAQQETSELEPVGSAAEGEAAGSKSERP